MWQAIIDTVRAAFHTLAGNKLRSALTLLGIVIGVAAVVAMSATIEGFRIEINRDMSALGTGVFQVQREPVGGPGFDNGARWRRAERRKKFTIADVQLLQDECTRCQQVAGEAWEGNQTIRVPSGAMLQNVQVVGSNPAFFGNNAYNLGEGRLMGEGETASGANVAVIGANVRDSLFPAGTPLGQRIDVAGRQYEVIGVLESRGSGLGNSYDDLVVIPLPAWYTQFGTRYSLHVSIMARDPGEMLAAQDQVVAILRRSRGVPPQEENDFEMFSNDSNQKDFEEMAGNIAVVTTGVCAIALLIGGIGVMNIMLVAVTERTSEIGVRRALGARRRRILAQFVLEAVVLCAFGGLIGLTLGGFGAFLIKVFTALPTTIPPWAIALSIAMASAVGLIFGSYPAFRASQLDPVEAMRQE